MLWIIKRSSECKRSRSETLFLRILNYKLSRSIFQRHKSGSNKSTFIDDITKDLESCLLDEYENNDETVDTSDEEGEKSKFEKSYLGRHEVILQSSSESSE